MAARVERTRRAARTPWMLRTVFWKSLRDQARSLPVWSVGLAALGGLYLLFYPTFRGGGVFSELMNKMPESYRAIITAGTGSDPTTPSGYLNTEFFAFMAPLIVLIYAVMAGANAVAGEEERGTLDLLLANPIGRTRMLLESFAGIVAGTALIGAISFVALWAGATGVGMDIALSNLAAAVLGMLLLALTFGSLALGIGAATGRKGLSLGMAVALAVATYFVNALAPVVKALRPYQRLSPFYHYIGNDPLRNGLAPGHTAILVALTVVFVAAGAIAFRRRDLAA